jgi:hypothetical protein
VSEWVHVLGGETTFGDGIVRALEASDHVLVPPHGRPSWVVDASAAIDPGAPERAVALAEAADARLLFLSSVEVYGNGGNAEISAYEPLIDPEPGREHLLDAEEAVFASGVRFLVLRAGVDAASGAGGAWVPVLDPDDLGLWVATAIELDLNGVYDAVTRVVLGTSGRSRRVTGEQLRRVLGAD